PLFFSVPPPPTASSTLSLHDALPICAWGLTPAFLECDTPLHPAVESALRDLSSRLGIPAGMLGWGIQPLQLPGKATPAPAEVVRSEEHTSELQSLAYLVCRLLLEKKK